MYLREDRDTFILQETSNLIKTTLKNTEYASRFLQSYLGFDSASQETINFEDLKASVQELALEILKADLSQTPNENALNYVVSQTRRIYEQILQTKNVHLLELNLRLLES
jgi:hypothetical protein